MVPWSGKSFGDIQMLANEKVREDLEVLTQETTYADAVRGGALAFFGDKYGDIVRVVTMASHDTDGAFSVELCVAPTWALPDRLAPFSSLESPA